MDYVALKDVLISPNAWQVLLFIIVALILAAFIIKAGIITIHTKHVKIGRESASNTERKIIREQIDSTHMYLMGLESKINSMLPDTKYNSYFLRYILEVVFDEMVNWITFNHINSSAEYITIKANKICSLVYSFPVTSEFKTKEFQERMKRWVAEIIEQMVNIRKLYSRGDYEKT